jgi:hypothetical protein
MDFFMVRHHRSAPLPSQERVVKSKDPTSSLALIPRAGFPTAISPNMDAWLKTHVALVGPIAYGLSKISLKMSILL